MFGFTEFTANDWEDDEEAQISCVFSKDDGETWSEKQVLFEKPEDAKNIMSLSLLRMNNDDIGAFYIVKNLDKVNHPLLCQRLELHIRLSLIYLLNAS